jgi:PadR family transcriptional regulator, regulatory protein PadR
MGDIPHILGCMGDKGELTPLQYALLDATARLRANGIPEIHPYGLTKMLEDADGDRRWIGYGSQYRAVQQLTERGYLTTRWEAPEVAEAEKRPRRRLYAITETGRRALANRPAPRPVPRYVSRLVEAV